MSVPSHDTVGQLVWYFSKDIDGFQKCELAVLLEIFSSTKGPLADILIEGIVTYKVPLSHLQLVEEWPHEDS